MPLTVSMSTVRASASCTLTTLPFRTALITPEKNGNSLS